MDKNELIQLITEKVLEQVSSGRTKPCASSETPVKEERLLIPVGISNRHLHVSQKDLDVLYGEGYQLQMRNPLRQPGEFASKETVTLIGPRHAIEGVRILAWPHEGY